MVEREWKIKVVWSNDISLPRVSTIQGNNGSIGYSNEFENWTYRFYPYLEINDIRT